MKKWKEFFHFFVRYDSKPIASIIWGQRGFVRVFFRDGVMCNEDMEQYKENKRKAEAKRNEWKEKTIRDGWYEEIRQRRRKRFHLIFLSFRIISLAVRWWWLFVQYFFGLIKWYYVYIRTTLKKDRLECIWLVRVD